ncbi:dienelactone hydrolase family protein [Nocardia sp. R6R-6]|uniref:dienelactone hydrolase family protein n=1 Tax=Nocardia sp. R6R-6 TaxID=3459303 RepID=UPI00403D8DC9
MSVDANVEVSELAVDELRAYLARPSSGGKSGMLLLPNVFGNAPQIRALANDIAAAGMTAVVWDMWHGPSTDNTPVADLIARLGTLDDETCLDELRRLVDHMVGELGLERVGVIGWCVGGRFALLAGGRDDRLANVVAYHPTVLIPPAANHTLDAAEVAARATSPVMMLYPKADELVPWESYVRLRDALESRDTGATIAHLYPGAGHGFAVNGLQGTPPNAAAFAASWPQVLAFCQHTTLA